jgi:pyruvate-ferredoxin/flavodoxin oxidoreductase
VVKRVRKRGHEVEHLPRAVRLMERSLRGLLGEARETEAVDELIGEAIDKTLAQSDLEDAEKVKLRGEFDLFREELGDFRFALSRPYYTLPEKQESGAGGLLSITVNPSSCKGCMECVAVCDDDALRSVTQTDESVKSLREQWDFWLDLPTTPRKYIRVDDLEEGIGALETILLDKTNYLAFTSGDGACLGCSEKTAVHLFVATIEALMAPRIARHVERLSELIARLEKHIQLKLVEDIDVGDPSRMARIVRDIGDRDVTLAGIAERMQAQGGGQPIDEEWLSRMTRLLAQLKDLRWRYQEGTSGRGRSKMGMLNATGCTSVWGSTFPFNPYPFPWAQDSPSMAMGVFEGHMARMAEGFRAVRRAELELAGEYRAALHDEFFTYFDWRDFSDEEWELCPPVVAVGGDGAMYDIGFQNLSRLMASGKPVKVLVVDTQVYSNTGGQACTSGFIGQISDMAQFGKAIKGKEEPRKEIGLIGMAHRTTYVLQSTIAHPSHMIEGFIAGLKTRRPALFNLYSSCQPEHGIGDDMSAAQAKLVVESRAYPLFRYDPDAGATAEECFDLEGNPAPEQDWPRYDGGPDDLRRLRDHRGPLPQALPRGAAGYLEREHAAARRVPRAGSGRSGGSLSLRVEHRQQAAPLPSSGEPADGGVLRGAPRLLDHAPRAGGRRPTAAALPRGDRGSGAAGRDRPHRLGPDGARRRLARCRRRRGAAGRGPRGGCSRRGAGRDRGRHGALDRHRGLHRVRRVHRPELRDLRLQRQEEGLHQGSGRRALQSPGQGRRALHRPRDPSRAAEEPRREGHRQVGPAGREVQLGVRGA